MAMSEGHLIGSMMRHDLEVRLRRKFERRYGRTKASLRIFEIGHGVFRVQAPDLQRSMDMDTSDWRIKVRSVTGCVIHLPDRELVRDKSKLI